MTPSQARTRSTVRRSPRTSVLAALAALAQLACPSPNDAPVITVGALLPATGELATFGDAEIGAVELAVDHINDAGGVLGMKLAVLGADDGTDPDKARAAARTLVAKKVPVVFGSIASGVTLAAAEVLTDAGIVQISPDSTSPAITSFPDDGYLFRTCPSDAFQGVLLAQRAYANGLRKASVVYVPNPYGEGLAQEFATAFRAAGGAIAFSGSYVEGQPSYVDLLSSVFADDPDTVLLVGYLVDGATIVKNAVASFPDKNVFWLFTDAVFGTDWIRAAGASTLNGLRHEGTTFGAALGENWAAFAAAYQAKTGKVAQDGDAVDNIYDAVMMAALAMARAKSAEPRAIRDALYLLKGGPQHTPSTIKEALAAAAAGENVAYHGVSGPIVFDANGDITVARYDVWKVANDELSFVERGVSPTR